MRNNGLDFRWSFSISFKVECYAKVIDLSREKEPEIFDAFRFGSIVKTRDSSQILEK